MKKKREWIAILLVGSFLTFLYPELMFNNQVVQVEEGTKPDDRDYYKELLHANPEKIRYKSRIWEWIMSLQRMFGE